MSSLKIFSSWSTSLASPRMLICSPRTVMVASKRDSMTCRLASFRPRSRSISTPCALIFLSATVAHPSGSKQRKPRSSAGFPGRGGFLICLGASQQPEELPVHLIRDIRLLRRGGGRLLPIIAVGRRLLVTRELFPFGDLQDPPVLDDIRIFDQIAVSLPDLGPHPCVVVNVFLSGDVPEAIPVARPGPYRVGLLLLQALHECRDLVLQGVHAVPVSRDHGDFAAGHFLEAV